MRNKIFVITMSLLLLAGCGRESSDAQIQRRLIGTWRLDQPPFKTIQNHPDGSYTVQFARGGSNVVLQGTWEVKAGFIVATMTNAPSWFDAQDPAARHRTESNRVVSVDAQELVILSSQDGKTVLTAHRQ